MSSQQPAESVQIACMTFAALAGVALVVVTPWGLALSPDSISYVQAARSIVEHGDLSRLPTHWPPLYPMLLAAGSFVFGEVGIGARALQGLFLTLNILLAAVILSRLVDTPSLVSSVVTLLLVVLFSLQPNIVSVHLQLWTEPAFIVLCLANVLLLERALRDPSAGKFLLAAALVAGTAVMVRYAGLFLIATNVLAILLLATSWRLRDRIAKGLFMGVVSIIPLLAWSMFNHFRGTGAGYRSLVYHPLSDQHISQALQTVSSWISLGPNFGWVVLLGVLLLTVLPWLAGKKAVRQVALARLLSIYTLTYVAFIVTSISWADAHTPLDQRILAPIFPAVFLLTVYAAWSIPWRWMRFAGIALLALPFFMNLPTSYALGNSSFRDGQGFGSRAVQEMPVLEFIRKLPPTWRVSTNTPEVFQLYLPQPATMFPRWIHPVDNLENASFSMELAEMAKHADLLAYLSAGHYRTYLPSIDQLSEIKGFILVYSGKDAAVWARSEHVRITD